MTKQITAKLLTLVIVSVMTVGLFASRPANALDPTVLITEVLTGLTEVDGTEYPKFEYVEIANITNQPIDMSGWRIEYLSAANNGSTASLVIDTLSSQIGPMGHGLWVHDGYWPVNFDGLFGVNDTSSSGLLAKTGGHVRLMNGTTMLDCVAWGSAVGIPGCDKVNSLPANGYSLQRELSNGTYNKTSGVLNLPFSARGGDISPVSITPPGGSGEEEQTDCSSVTISEILANPAGEDVLNEYIEIYNPTPKVIELHGCSLGLASGKSYEFPAEIRLAPGEYRALRHAITSLQLTNSGGEVSFGNTTSRVSITYPALGDDEAWANIGGQWQLTNQPTPDALNVLSNVSIGSDEGTPISDPAPCPSGKYRNPDTGRCRNIIEIAQTQVACAPDQERNPDTGRCRKKTVASVAVACQPGQERNSATNRCRKVEAATNTKVCGSGQERNPDTGRCKKIVNGKATTAVMGAATKKTYHTTLVVIMIVALVSYGIYEYRHDMRNTLIRLKKRFARN